MGKLEVRNTVFFHHVGESRKEKGADGAYRHAGDLFGHKGRLFFVPVLPSSSSDPQIPSYDFKAARRATFEAGQADDDCVHLEKPFPLTRQDQQVVSFVQRMSVALAYGKEENERFLTEADKRLLLPPVVSIGKAWNFAKTAATGQILAVHTATLGWREVMAAVDTRDGMDRDPAQTCVKRKIYLDLCSFVAKRNPLTQEETEGTTVPPQVQGLIEDYYIHDVFLRALATGKHRTILFGKRGNASRAQEKFRLAALVHCEKFMGCLVTERAKAAQTMPFEAVFVPCRTSKNGSLLNFTVLAKDARPAFYDVWGNIMEVGDKPSPLAREVGCFLKKTFRDDQNNPYLDTHCRFVCAPR